MRKLSGILVVSDIIVGFRVWGFGGLGSRGLPVEGFQGVGFRVVIMKLHGLLLQSLLATNRSLHCVEICAHRFGVLGLAEIRA